MRDLTRIIDEPPRGHGERAAFWLRRRRFTLGAGLAVLEVLYTLVARPGVLAMSLVAALALGLSVYGVTRLGPGLARDALVVVAVAQALVLVVPFAIGFGVALGLVAALALLALLAVAAFRLRV